jgi:hypothetical protein
MKKLILSLFTATVLFFSTGCESWLDVNQNPNGPEKVTAYLYLGPMEQQLALAMQWDARMIGYYTQNFAYYSASYVYDLQGTPAWTSDMAEHWRVVYWKLGINLSDMIAISEKEQRWDLAGIGYVLRAYGWQMLTDMHGPIILKQAFQPGLYKFAYDDEKAVYEEVVRLCLKAIENLDRTDGSVSAAFAGKGDQIYKGDRLKWKKFAYGLLAMNMSRLSNKSTLYNADKVIEYVDNSFSNNNDNALINFAGSVSNDASFFGPMRGNLLGARVSKFMVGLTDGSVFGTPDPRRKIMFPPSDNINNNVTGATYIGVEQGKGYSSIVSADLPYNIYGLKSVAAAPAGTVGRYIYTNNVKWPIMTYSQLQFIKAEAAFRKGDKPLALSAYTNGVESAMAFVSSYAGIATKGFAAGSTTSTETETVSAITPSEISSYTATAVPTDPNNLLMSHIMCQKYIHMWGWSHMETWSDMRRFHYTDTYPGEATSVYVGFTLPALASENNGLVIYRVRPRYNSEYVWNAEELDKIGALNRDYHTKETWYSKPE